MAPLTFGFCFLRCLFWPHLRFLVAAFFLGFRAFLLRGAVFTRLFVKYVENLRSNSTLAAFTASRIRRKCPVRVSTLSRVLLARVTSGLLTREHASQYHLPRG